jgi:hypothetical protein
VVTRVSNVFGVEVVGVTGVVGRDVRGDVRGSGNGEINVGMARGDGDLL